jgi:hypothetical protein
MLIGVLFFFLFSSSALATECGIKLGGGGKDSSWIKLKNDQITKANDIGGPWSFIRQTYGKCDFTLFNEHKFKGRRANYGTDIGIRLRVGAKGGIDKNGWKARSLIITPRNPQCTIELGENEPSGYSGASNYRRQTFFGPSEFRNITGWSNIEKVSKYCKYKLYSGVDFSGHYHEVTSLAHTKKLAWRIRSIKIESNNTRVNARRGRPTFKEIKHVKGRCLDISGGVNRNETNVQIYQCNNSKSQQWYWNKNKQIVNVMGRCLDVSGVDITNNSTVEIFKCNKSITQKWEKISNSRIQNLSGFCLDIVNGVNANKTNVQLYRCINADAQQWR